MSNVFDIDQSGKQEYPVRCPCCATTLVIRHGTYPRAHPEQPGQVAVQRYLCKSPECSRKTFSILSFPFLPIIRHFCLKLLICHLLHNVDNNSQATTARCLQVPRGVIKRLSIFCIRFVPWLKHEQEIADWGPDPTANSAARWSDFTRDFSQVFYPKRWATPWPTQYIPSCF